MYEWHQFLTVEELLDFLTRASIYDLVDSSKEEEEPKLAICKKDNVIYVDFSRSQESEN